jgi:hypothetical protein
VLRPLGGGAGPTCTKCEWPRSARRGKPAWPSESRDRLHTITVLSLSAAHAHRRSTHALRQRRGRGPSVRELPKSQQATAAKAVRAVAIFAPQGREHCVRSRHQLQRL